MSSPVEGDAGADLNWQRSEGDPCPRCKLPALRFFEIDDDDGTRRVCGDCVKRAAVLHEIMRARREHWERRMKEGQRRARR